LWPCSSTIDDGFGLDGQHGRFASTGADIPRVDEIRYLGIFIVRSRKFKCSLDYAKKSCTIEQPVQFLVRSGDMLRNSTPMVVLVQIIG